MSTLPEGCVDFKTLEQIIFDSSLELGRQVLREMLEQEDDLRALTCLLITLISCPASI